MNFAGAAERLRQRRRDLRLSQRRVVEAMRSSVVRVRNLEQDPRVWEHLTVRELMWLCRVLAVTPDELLMDPLGESDADASRVEMLGATLLDRHEPLPADTLLRLLEVNSDELGELISALNESLRSVGMQATRTPDGYVRLSTQPRSLPSRDRLKVLAREALSRRSLSQAEAAMLYAALKGDSPAKSWTSSASKRITAGKLERAGLIAWPESEAEPLSITEEVRVSLMI